MSLASYKTVLESVTSHEQSAAESSTVMVQRRRSSFVRILPDYIVGPPNFRVLLTVYHVAAELLRLVRTSQSDTIVGTGSAPVPQKCSFPPEIETYIRVLVPIQVCHPNTISIGSDAFAQLIGVPNTQTDRQKNGTCDVHITTGRVYTMHACDAP